MGRMLLSGLIGLLWITRIRAQDTLPDFSAVSHSNGRVMISWHNNYSNVTQISIQRSTDSLKNFTTFLAVQHPTIPENGFTSKSAGAGIFYRFFIVFADGKYVFSRSRRAVSPGTLASVQAKSPIPSQAAPPAQNPPDNSPAANPGPEDNQAKGESQRIRFAPDDENSNKPAVKAPPAISKRPPPPAPKTILFEVGDTTIARLAGKQILHFRDSILRKTKDTLVFVNADTIQIRRFVPKEVYRVSTNVFAGKDGNVYVSLPDASRRPYLVRFLEENNKPLFELKDVKDPSLIIDKTNFVHAGWFRFELYEDGKLKEKNKLFIPKEF